MKNCKVGKTNNSNKFPVTLFALLSKTKKETLNKLTALRVVT